MKNSVEGLSSAEREALSLFRENLKEAYAGQLVKTVLFGSRARREGSEDSDIDLLVLLKNEEHSLRKGILDKAGDIFLEKGVNITPLVMSSERYEWLREIERGIALEIERDGIEI